MIYIKTWTDNFVTGATIASTTCVLLQLFFLLLLLLLFIFLQNSLTLALMMTIPYHFPTFVVHPLPLYNLVPASVHLPLLFFFCLFISFPSFITPSHSFPLILSVSPFWLPSLFFSLHLPHSLSFPELQSFLTSLSLSFSSPSLSSLFSSHVPFLSQGSRLFFLHLISYPHSFPHYLPFQLNSWSQISTCSDVSLQYVTLS